LTTIKITDPIRFFLEVIPRNSDRVNINDINTQYLSEFLEALQTSINQMSADGVRISFVASKGRDLSRYMSTTLDEDWKRMRGFEIQAVGIASISYDDESTKLINMRNQGAMLGDPSVREGYVQGAVARGLEAAGSNPSGSMAGFMGVGMGMQAGGGFMGAASESNRQQMQAEAQAKSAPAQPTPAVAGWNCECGANNTGKFCSECGKKRPVQDGWVCGCGAENKGKFCAECGKPKPEVSTIRCGKCGYELAGGQPMPKFCPDCGAPTP
jgi:membrane protease subunit (stomatin/prohibitin family)